MTPKKNPLIDESLEAESKQGADGAEALPQRLERYAKARDRAILMSDYAKAEGHAKEFHLLDRCGNYLQFRHYYTVDKVRLHAAEFCRKHLLCPLCAIRRGSKTLTAYLEKYHHVIEQNPTVKPYFVTFTVKNGDDLAERFRHLRHKMQAMNKRRSLKRRQFEVEKAEGAVWSYEVTNKGNGWHPHAHCIWLCATPPSQSALKAEWEAMTGDSFMVDVRPIDDPVNGFLEVFKYAVKFGDLSVENNWTAYEVLTGERLISSFGLLYGVEVPEALTDEPLDELPYFELLYHHIKGAGYSLVTPKP